MSCTATITLQTIWDCKWSHPGYRLRGFPDGRQPESLWACVRDGQRRPVNEQVCANCPDWEADEVHERP